MKITKEQMKCLSKKIAKKINDNIDEENKKNAEEIIKSFGINDIDIL